MHTGWDGGRVAAARVESRGGSVVYFLQFLREIFVRAHELVVFISILLYFLTLLVLPLLLLQPIYSLMQRHFWLSSDRIPSSPLATFHLPPSDLISLLDLPLQLLLIHPLLHFLIILLVLRWGEVGTMLVCAYDAEGVADVEQFVAFVVVGAIWLLSVLNCGLWVFIGVCSVFDLLLRWLILFYMNMSFNWTIVHTFISVILHNRWSLFRHTTLLPNCQFDISIIHIHQSTNTIFLLKLLPEVAQSICKHHNNYNFTSNPV